MADNNEEQQEQYLIPVAAILGLYSAFAIVRMVHLLYQNWSARKRAQGKPLRSTGQIQTLTGTGENNARISVVTLGVTLLLALIGYSFCVARIDGANWKAEHQRTFDPFVLLELPPDTTDASAIKAAYRAMSLKYHPEAEQNQASVENTQEIFSKIQLAYRTLTDESSMRNYKLHGHPDGPLQVPVFRLALPNWLLHPQGPMARSVRLLYWWFLCFCIYYVISTIQQSYAAKQQKQLDEKKKHSVKMTTGNTVSLDDLQYLAKHLTHDSTNWQVLMAVISSPELVAWSQRQVEQVQIQHEERKKEIEEQRQQQLSGNSNSQKNSSVDEFDALVDGGGWGDDDDEEEDGDSINKIKAARQAEKEKQRDLDSLKKATGKSVLLLEGIDDGVLGQEWVERTLKNQSKMGFPPHDLGCLEGQLLDADPDNRAKNQTLPPSEHPGMRRLLCMTMGRINSQMLNTHPELLQAGSAQLIDQTYFRASMEFRQRCHILLEATLKVATALGSSKLVATVIDTVAMFKIGTINNPEAVQQFKKMLQQQNGCLPQLKIHKARLVRVQPGDNQMTSASRNEEDEDPVVATEDMAELLFEMERLHAEKFLQAKLAMFQKQGIPPQVALQGYREGWWCMLRRERLDNTNNKDDAATKQKRLKEVAPILKQMKIADEDIAKFNDNMEEKDRLCLAMPMMVTKIAQKTGKVAMRLKMPQEPGKYRFHVMIKSQDFLGAGQEFAVDARVLDKSTVVRNDEKEKEGASNDNDESESKKEK